MVAGGAVTAVTPPLYEPASVRCSARKPGRVERQEANGQNDEYNVQPLDAAIEPTDKRFARK